MSRKLSYSQAFEKNKPPFWWARIRVAIVLAVLWPFYLLGLVSDQALEGVETGGVKVLKWLTLVLILGLLLWYVLYLDLI